jgi:hypothetical protein
MIIRFSSNTNVAPFRQLSAANFMIVRFCLLSSVILLVGCGSDSPFSYIRTSGQIAYEDGTPIPGGIRLIFVAQDTQAVGNAHPRRGMANVGADGKFDCVTSYKYGDGLVPGKHKVVIQGAADRGGMPSVPKEDTSEDTTKIIVDTAHLPLDIKVPKPK